jgi:HK97 family phage prohead protease
MGEKMEEVTKIGLTIEPAKTKDLGYGVVEVIVSTGSKDRHNEVINPDGIDLKQYNGVVLYGHDYEGLPIGKAIKVWKDKTTKTLRAKMQFAIEEYPFAKTVYNLVKGGYLTDVSIGGIVKKWNEDYSVIEEMEMIEFSVVPIGANRDAKIVAASVGMTIDRVSEEYHEALAKHWKDKAENLPEHEIKSAIKNMKIVLAALEGEVDSSSNETVVDKKRLISIKAKAKELDHEAEGIIRYVKLKTKEIQ